jgi:hypothetical protein
VFSILHWKFEYFYLWLVLYPAIYTTHFWINGMYVGVCVCVYNLSSDDTTYVQLCRSAEIAFSTPFALTQHWPHCVSVSFSRNVQGIRSSDYIINPSRRVDSFSFSQEPFALDIEVNYNIYTVTLIISTLSQTNLTHSHISYFCDLQFISSCNVHLGTCFNSSYMSYIPPP